MGKGAGGAARTRVAAAGSLAVCLLAGVAGVRALEPTTPLANLNRQSWAMENGLPQNTVQALAQTANGYLWLGTEVGLVRFDGVGFVLFDEHSKPALPGSDVQCLLAAKDGALWVGTSSGLARLKDGAVTVLTTADGLPANQINRLAQGREDSVIAWTSAGRAQIFGKQNLAIQPAASDSPAGSLPGVELHVALGGEMYAEASKTAAAIMRGTLIEQQWFVGRDLPGSRIQALFGDRQGALWIGTNSGLVRYAEGKLDKLPVTDPLASASVLAILEDREGNLWVGTESNGLQILRDQRFQTLTTRDGLPSDNVTTVVQDGAGTLWVGTAGNGVTAIKPGTTQQAKTYGVRDGLLSEVILSLASAPNGDLWVGTADGLSRIRRSAVASFTSADGLPDDFIRSLHADADGTLWIGTRRGVTHWSKPGELDAGLMKTYTTANGLGSNMVGAMARDAHGDLWIATFAGLSRLHQGVLTNFTAVQGLSSNVITAILARANGSLLVGTQDHGWNVWDGNRFKPVTDHNLGSTTIHAILDDGRNHLWFATGTGLARCDCTESMAPMQSADCAHWLEFGTADGLRSRETAVNSHPSAWRAQDGHMWFATPKGLVEVDPAHFPVNEVAPPVVVERFAVDDAEQALHAAGLKVPAGHNHFQFEYAGLSFVAPQKVRYRYKLEGFDHDWTDAASRRTAYYTNIPPGHYTFRVQAANNDGVWNTEGTALAFQLLPHFYQTVWFYVLLALAAVGLVLLALKLRLLRAEREFRAVLGERNRIAREIHDTLAQGYVGISVQLEVLSELLRHNKTEKASKHLDKVRGYVREGLADARQSIWALRSQDTEEATLPVRMRRLVETSGGHGLDAKFGIFGAYRPLPPGTENEILRIAQEALHNVKKHAGAASVKVQLEYRRNEIALEIRDDGRGFSAANDGAPLESPPGHYGLTGMRERAASIGGTLEVTSEPGAGTTVRMRAPAPGKTHEPKDARDSEAAGEAATTKEATFPQETTSPERITLPQETKEQR
ncbi:sensor histidine kinase [Occallatibacter riparius]|uniref:Histidine kinase n=1 Tax=Occallatibacter riparius TaxID=1002689 RepID=A0A9J7BVD2_9BACT|nr:sensor histidine kinase [Occallatibacter riparius]UWZ85738.1 histidine kinase [Occallatibacter riparius]